MYEDEDLQEIHEDIIELNEDISDLRRDLNNISASVEGSGENVILNQTAEARFKKPPLPLGNTEQNQYSGKNLIEIDEGLNNNLVKIDNKYKLTKNGDYRFSNRINVDIPAGDIVFQVNSIEWNVTGGTQNYLGLVLTYEDNSETTMPIWSTHNIGIRINKTTTTKKIIKVRLYLDGDYDDNSNIVFNDFMIFYGTEASSYEPYVGGQASPNPDYPQEITNVTGDVEVAVENKNLFDASERTFDSTYNGDFIMIKDRNSKWYGYIDISKVKFPLTISTFIYNSTSNISDTNLRISLRDKNKKEILFRVGTSVTSSNKKSIVTILQSDIIDEMKYLTIGIRVQDGGYTENTQIEQGITSTNFVEHKEQKFIFPLGNEKLMLGDYLADDGIHHVRGQIVLDGSDDEGWYKNWEEDENHRVFMADKFLSDSKRFPSPTMNILCKSNYFKAVSYDAGDESIWRLRRNDNYPNLISINDYEKSAYVGTVVIKYDASSDINEFKTWLSTHNTMIEYLLEEEVIVPYTSAQREVYNQIKEAISYDEQTNVSSNTIALFNVKAFRNMNASIESLQSRIELLKGRS